MITVQKMEEKLSEIRSGWMEFYGGRRVLVTGGTGSIGARLVERLLENGAQVWVLSRDENLQHLLWHRMLEKFNAIGEMPKMRLRIGDVRNRQTVGEAARGIEIVFHTAAMKHVNFCENNPWEAVQTNILGAQNVREACLDVGVGVVVVVSTDKAADPAGVMGETKHLQERLFLASEMLATRAVVTRFGNVLGSAGSIVWKFKEQIAKGGYLTVTDPEMLRFVMTPQQATELVLWAGARAPHKTIVTRQMVSASLETLIKALADGRDYQFIASGPRPGEKREEVLFSEAELGRVGLDEVEIGKVAMLDENENPHPPADLSSFDIHKQQVSEARLREMLVQAGVFS